jgi:hypothetical protein
MPQRNVTTSTPVGYTIATMQALVTSLYAAIQSGLQVNASDVVSWKTNGYDLWRTHTHTAQDRSGIDTFGNLTVYGVAGTHVTANTNQPQSNAQPPFTTPAGIVSGGEITAADINSMILIANTMRTHSHVITDSIGATVAAVVINDGTYTAFQYVAAATAILEFQNNGTLIAADSGALGGQWIDMSPTDIATAASYDIFVQHVGGSAPSGSALNTWLNLGTTRSWSIDAPYIGALNTVSTTLSVQVRNSSTLAVVDTATIILSASTDNLPPPPTCFPAGNLVLMGDGSWQPIQLIHVGDMVMGMTGPTPVIEVDRPHLGSRKMLRFANNSLRWSEEHAMWTRDNTQSQWWWSANRQMWINEASSGEIGGLTDNESMRTGDQAAEWAHLSGWKANVIIEEPRLPYTTRLYLPRTEGSPIVVNGYVVGAGVNQAGFDYSTLDWDAVRASLPVVQPLPIA